MTLVPVAQDSCRGNFYRNQNQISGSAQNKAFSPKNYEVGSENKNNRIVLESTYYSSEKLTLDYTNKDGDSVSLNYENVKYQKANLSIESNSSSDDWKEIVENVKDEYMKLQEKLINKCLESVTGKEIKQTEDVEVVESKPISGLPEYWNAENTSQRIVDFATSFSGMTESEGKDYYDLMKGAIEEGFSQARSMMGEMPGEISDLTNDTYNLTMQKLDEWAIANGIEIDVDDSVAITA